MPESIALGFGNNIDYEIEWNAGVIQDLILRYDIRHHEVDLDRVVVRSERDLVLSILGFLEAGVGGERFASSSAILDQFARRFDKQITLGGTSVRAAIAMRKLGYTSALHLVTLNEDVRRLLPRDCPYVCSNAADSSYPHLIVQFGAGDCVRANDIDIRSSQANRIIYHNDADNIAMRLDEDFSEQISEARVLLISGFNAMQSEALLTDRLDTLLRMMEHLPDDAAVYYEDAGFYEPRFSRQIYRALAKRIDVVGMNEDELQAHLGRPLNLLDAFQVNDALVDLQAHIPVPTIVVHSKYWALAYGKRAGGLSKALEGGVSMATTRYCHGDDFTEAHYRATRDLPPNPAGSAFAEAMTGMLGDRISCVPVAQVEPSRAVAVGLGDAFVGGFLPELSRRRESDRDRRGRR